MKRNNKRQIVKLDDDNVFEMSGIHNPQKTYLLWNALLESYEDPRYPLSVKETEHIARLIQDPEVDINSRAFNLSLLRVMKEKKADAQPIYEDNLAFFILREREKLLIDAILNREDLDLSQETMAIMPFSELPLDEEDAEIKNKKSNPCHYNILTRLIFSFGAREEKAYDPAIGAGFVHPDMVYAVRRLIDNRDIDIDFKPYTLSEAGAKIELLNEQALSWARSNGDNPLSNIIIDAIDDRLQGLPVRMQTPKVFVLRAAPEEGQHPPKFVM